jgi:hypothetical protein
MPLASFEARGPNAASLKVCMCAGFDVNKVGDARVGELMMDTAACSNRPIDVCTELHTIVMPGCVITPQKQPAHPLLIVPLMLA